MWPSGVSTGNKTRPVPLPKTSETTHAAAGDWVPAAASKHRQRLKVTRVNYSDARFFVFVGGHVKNTFRRLKVMTNNKI